MKIAVSGTANIGKSTYIKDFLENWKMYKTPEKSYRDIIKEKNLKINEESSEESQNLIFDSMFEQISSYEKKDFVIFDRCPLDVMAYNLWLYANNKVSEDFCDKSRNVISESLKMFDIIFFFPISKFSMIEKSEQEENPLRSESETFREEIDNIFKAFQQSYLAGDGKIFPKNDCPAMIEIYGSRKERMKLTEFYLKEDGKPFGEEESLINDIKLPTQQDIKNFGSPKKINKR